MCGIGGVFSTTDPPSASELSAMADRLVHRGPDEGGTFRDGPVGMAHRRLSIIDLNTGRQPIESEDGSVVVTYNGEIYNYLELRDELSAAGHRFATGTDTEVLVHLYEDHGLSMFEHFSGMFAFALWDGDRERLVLARDRMGIKPLVFAENDGRVGFASEIPALLAADIDHGGLDGDALARYFALGFVPSPRTAFRNAWKLQPGEYAVVTEGGVRTERYYRPRIRQRDPGMAEAASELRRRLEDAVARRLQADVPVGAFLSGGIDSSILVGVMAEFSDEPVRTYTVGFEEELFDETWAAREVAEHRGTDHTEFRVSPKDVRAAIPDVVDKLGEPFADNSLIPTAIVARKTATDVKVALSGDGADELFAGYDMYRGEYVSGYYRALPASVRKRLISPIVNRLRAHRGSWQGELARKAHKFVRADEDAVVDRHLGWLLTGDRGALASYTAGDPTAAAHEYLADLHETLSIGLPSPSGDTLGRIQAVDAWPLLGEGMLRKVDYASMSHSIEARVPFLDQTVVEYSMSLPTGYKISPRKRKRVLKRAFDDLLPRSIRRRGKRGFDMPIGEWFRDELSADFERERRSLPGDLLDPDRVATVYDEHAAGRRDHGKFLWSVYVYARWRRHMEGEDLL